jgi:hypothetical protein
MLRQQIPQQTQIIGHVINDEEAWRKAIDVGYEELNRELESSGL